MDNKQKLTAHNAVIESNNNILRSLPVYENLTDLVNYQPPVLEQIKAVLETAAGVGGGSGKYVWEKCELTEVENPTFYTADRPTITTWVLESDDVDLSQVDAEFFDGFDCGVYQNGTLTTTLTFVYSDGTLSWSGTSIAFNWDASKKTMIRLSGSSGAEYTWQGSYDGTKLVYNRIAFIVSDDKSAYPDGDTQDGYWYELFTNSVLAEAVMADCGEVTMSSTSKSLTVSHSLGVTPTGCMIYDTSSTTSTRPSLIMYPFNGSSTLQIAGISSISTSGTAPSRQAGTVTFYDSVGTGFTGLNKFKWIVWA